MTTFDYANTALRKDLIAYSDALRTLVGKLPQARGLCDRVLKEVRLARALLAFASGPQVIELGNILYKLQNLWPYRDLSFARTLGFTDEIKEALELKEEALRAVKLLARQGDVLSSEVITCFANIADALEQERQLLEACDGSIRPHARNMELTRKRLNLLIAAVDARMPESPEQILAVQAYSNAATLLADWENGVPIDSSGVEILERCIDILDAAGHAHFVAINPAQV